MPLDRLHNRGLLVVVVVTGYRDQTTGTGDYHHDSELQLLLDKDVVKPFPSDYDHTKQYWGCMQKPRSPVPRKPA